MSEREKHLATLRGMMCKVPPHDTVDLAIAWVISELERPQPAATDAEIEEAYYILCKVWAFAGNEAAAKSIVVLCRVLARHFAAEIIAEAKR